MSDSIIFEHLPAWLGRNFLPALVAVCVVVILLLYALLYALDRHARLYSDGERAYGLPERLIARLRSRYPRFTAFIGNPYGGEHRLARYLVVAFLAGFAGLYGLAQLLDELHEIEELDRFDRMLAGAVSSHALAAAVAFFEVFTWLGHGMTLALLGLVVGMILLARGRKVLLIGWVGALVGQGLLSVALKASMHRARPEVEAAVDALGWSFPSGHTMAAVTAYGMLGYIVAQHWPQHRMLIATAAALVILLVGASRLYLGVHYLSDVLGGLLAATAWLAMCVAACELAQHRSTHNRK
jgi:undecaprenyl-diphosphatase